MASWWQYSLQERKTAMTDRRDLRVTSPPRPPPHWHLSLAGDEAGIAVVSMIIRSFFEGHMTIVENRLPDGTTELCVPWYDKVFMPPVLETIEVELLRRGHKVTILAREVKQCQMRLI